MQLRTCVRWLRHVRPGWVWGFLAVLLLGANSLLAQNGAERNPGSGEGETSPILVVEWLEPPDAEIELLATEGWINGKAPFRVGLVPGHTYVFRISTVVADEPVTVSATIRVLAPLQTPPDISPWGHPVPVTLTPNDFNDLNNGALVTKVIVLERPDTAVPVAYPATALPEVDAPVVGDPLEVAFSNGAPLAILMVGTRVYEREEAEYLPRGPVVFGPEQRSEASGATPGKGPVKQASFDVPVRRSPLPLPGALADDNAPVPPTFPRLDPERLNPALLYDGGDRFPPAGRDPLGVTFGLDPSDTVGFYTAGKELRKATARPVFLFAPRYIAIRSVRRGGEERGVQPVDTVRRVGMRGSFTSATRARVERMRQDVALEIGETRPILASSLSGTAIASSVRVVHANVQTNGIASTVLAMALDSLSAAQEAWLASRIQAAEVWRVEQLPAYTYLARSGVVIKGLAREEALVRVDEPPREPGHVIMWKAASTAEAHPGEIVEFVIYYKNVGQEPVEALSIMDSLLPRLEYVPDSAGASRAAVFTVGENPNGSVVLRWDIGGTIKPGEQGAVWFKARVR